MNADRQAQILAEATPEPGTVLAKAVLAVARRLGRSDRELATILGTSEASISRLRRGRAVPMGSKEAELAVLFVRLYRSLDTLVGGDERQARRWFEAGNVHLGAAPIERVGSVEGLVDVVQYLDAFRGKL